jgi:hypothetical protein
MAGVVALGVATARAEVATPPENCPGYVDHLRTAHDCLARGDRSGAIVELRKAKDCLTACLRDHDEAAALALAAPEGTRRLS